MKTINALFGAAKPQVIAFSELLAEKRSPRGKRNKELFEELRTMARKAAKEANSRGKRYHELAGSMSLALMMGIAIGLGVIDPDELIRINNLR